MSRAKRFWTDVAVIETEGGFSLTLDGRAIKTPAKNELTIPMRALADAIADEWRDQGEFVDPMTMPQTRYTNSIIDGIALNRAAVVESVATYGGTDLLCYRAEHPDSLIERQTEHWDPLLDWAREHLDAPLTSTQGVMYSKQPSSSLDRLTEAVERHSDFELAALHDLVAISGSLVLGLAVSAGRLPESEALALSRLDENWQIEQWGDDDEALGVAAKKAREFGEAERLLTLVR